MRKMNILILMSLIAGVLPLGSAMAQTDGAEGLPTRVADRPLTLPERTLRAEVDAGVSHLRIFDADINVAQMRLGAAYGITDDIEVGATIAPMTLGILDSELRYGDPSIRARYRFMNGDVEMAAEVEATIPVQDDAESDDLAIRVPVRFHADRVRVDTGLETRLEFGDDIEARLRVPVEGRLNITDELHVGLHSGLALESLENAGDNWRIPLASSVGYTIDGEAVTTDIGVAFELPAFVANGEIETGVWTAMLNANLHFDL